MRALVHSALVGLLLTSAASATPLPAWPLSPTLDSSGWSIDRYDSKRFVNAGSLLGRTNVLDLNVDAVDGPLVRPAPFTASFYNLQGRKIGLNQLPAGSALAASVYIPAAWAQSNAGNTALNRRTDLFAVLTPFNTLDENCPGENCFVFAGIDFTNANQTDQLLGGGIPRFRIFRKASAEGWENVNNVVRYDQWNEFCILWTGTAIEYYINGELALRDNAPSQPDPSFGPPRFLRVATLYGYNFGSTYSSYWSNAEAGPKVDVQVLKSGPGQVFPGQQFSFSLQIRNNGPQIATGVVLEDPTPAGLTLVGVSAPCNGGFPCTLGTLAVGQVINLTATYTVNSGFTGALQNTATVRSDGIDSVPPNNISTVNVGSTPVTQLPVLRHAWLLLAGFALAGWLALRRQA